MKKSILTSVIAFVFTICAFAQTKTTINSGSSYSISISDDDGTEYANTSVSIKKTDVVLKLNASFNKERTNKVKDFLLKKLDKRNLKIKGSTHLWTINSSGEEIFECKLTKGSLRMFVDREAVSNTFYEKMNVLAYKLKDLISGSDSKKEAQKDKNRAQKDLERAERDLERAKQDVERAQRDLKQAK